MKNKLTKLIVYLLVAIFSFSIFTTFASSPTNVNAATDKESCENNGGTWKAKTEKCSFTAKSCKDKGFAALSLDKKGCTNECGSHAEVNDSGACICKKNYELKDNKCKKISTSQESQEGQGEQGSEGGSQEGQEGTGTTITSVCDSSSAPQAVKDAAGCNGNSDSLKTIIVNILKSIIAATGIVAAIFVVIGGIHYMTSTGDPGKLEKARKTILYALIGLVICALAFAIVNWAVSAVNNSGKTQTTEDEAVGLIINRL